MPSRHRAVRRAGALAGARAHLPADPAGAVERPRRRARRRAGGRRAAEVQPVRRAARAARRRRRDDGPVRPAAAGEAPGARPGAASPPTVRCSKRSSGRRRSRRWSATRVDPDTVAGAPVRARPPQAGAAQARLAGRGPRRATSTARRTRSSWSQDGWEMRPYQREAVEGFWHGGSGVVVLPCGAGKTIVGAAAMAEAKATTLILVTNTVAARQWRHELLKRTSLTEDEIGEYSGCAQGDPAGHHRDVPGDDHPPEGRLHPPGAVRRPRLGPGRLRRGAPAAGADLPDDRRPAGPAPARPDRHPGPRGRPRGRRVLADRARSGTTRRGRTSRRRATSRRPTASRCG